jgi:hypothetical protein
MAARLLGLQRGGDAWEEEWQHDGRGRSDNILLCTNKTRHFFVGFSARRATSGGPPAPRTFKKFAASARTSKKFLKLAASARAGTAAAGGWLLARSVRIRDFVRQI